MSTTWETRSVSMKSQDRGRGAAGRPTAPASSSRAWRAVQPPPASSDSRGRGREGGGEVCSWVDDDCTPRPRVKALSGRMEKASAPLCCIRHSELPTAPACRGGEKHQPAAGSTPSTETRRRAGLSPSTLAVQRARRRGGSPQRRAGVLGPCPSNPTVHRNHSQGWLHPTHPKGSDPGGQGRGPRLHV